MAVQSQVWKKKMVGVMQCFNSSSDLTIVKMVVTGHKKLIYDNEDTVNGQVHHTYMTEFIQKFLKIMQWKFGVPALNCF